MRRRDIGFRRLVLPTLTAIVLAMSMTGCNPTEDAVVTMLKDYTQVEVMVPVEVNNENIKEGNIIIPEWVELGDMTSYPELREAVDVAFNIDQITAEDGTTDKAGVLYTLNQKDTHYTNNSTMLNAFQNKTFREEYWNDDTAAKLISASEVAYADTDESNGMQAAINAYYGLLPDTEPNYFNADEAVTRVEFMSMVFKAENPVQSLRKDDGYWESSNKDDLSIFAQYLDEKAYLQYDKGYDYNNSTAQGSMSKAEAVYLIVNQYFADQLKEVNLETAKVTYTDIKNGGDLALKRGFTDEAKETRGNIGYLKGYVLNYMFEIGEADEDIYKAYVVASDLGLLPSADKCNWNSTITKKEAIELMLRTYEIYGEQTGIAEGVGKRPEQAVADSGETSGITFSDSEENFDEIDKQFNEYIESEEFTDEVETDLPPAEIETEVVDKIEVEVLDQTMYAVSSVNVREGDNADTTKVGSLSFAQEVKVTGQSLETKWFQIKMSDGSIAYVSNNYLSLTKPTRQTKVVEQPAAPTTPSTPATPAFPDMSGLGGSIGSNPFIQEGEFNTDGATGNWAGVEIY